MRTPLIAVALTVSVLGCRTTARNETTSLTPASPEAYTGWHAYGASSAGDRYVDHDQIAPDNVGTLVEAWSYRTGETGQNARDGGKITFQATPIYFEETLYFPTAYGKIIALDAASGHERWVFDAEVDRDVSYSEVTSRGVSLWLSAESGPCSARIFASTIDARLIALDARSGLACGDFGRDGQVRLHPLADIRYDNRGDYQMTSAPAVVNEFVIVGSSIGDNWHADTGSGVVTAFDARTGEVVWQWNPLPPDLEAGAANAWSTISADPARDLVFVPTSSPSPDFFGGLRPGDNRFANSVVALRASTGEVVWHFQTVHHDLWDYDLAAQPALVEVDQAGAVIPVVVQATKTGNLFVLHRETGQPLFPVEERPVPLSDIPGEASWPTQPFPSAPRALMPHAPLTSADAWGLTAADREFCRAAIERHTSGIFSPPSVDGTIMYPGNGAGTNWGSVAFHPGRQILVLNTSRLATFVQLVPRAEFDDARGREGDAFEFGRQRTAPYGMKRATFLSPNGIPCLAPPWGTLIAVDLSDGEVVWEVPIGSTATGPLGSRFPAEVTINGLPNAGGPLVTGSGLIFLGATMDDQLRAFDLETGEILWSTTLPFSAIATPMSYEAGGRQFVATAAGGHAKMGLPVGDYVVAFALPD